MPINDSYDKELRRIQKLINQAKKNGVIFIRSPLPEEPETITKEYIDTLSNISLQDILNKGSIVDEESGGLIPIEKSEVTLKKGKAHYSFDIKTARKLGKPKDPLLSEEELKEIRSKAAKKAQQTIKKRMEEDPEYSAKIKAIREKALKKALETIKKKMKEDPVYPARIKENRRKSLSKTRASNKEVKREPLEVPFGSEDISKSPDKASAILENVKSILSDSINPEVSKFCLETLDNACAMYGEKEIARRFEFAEHSAIESARIISFDSDQRKVMDSTYQLIRIMYNDDIPVDVESAMENNYSYDTMEKDYSYDDIEFEEIEDEDLPF